MNKLKKKYWDKGIVQSGTWIIFPKDVAISFIHDCEKEKIEILGIDGFFLHKDSIEPSMDNSLDYTSSNNEEYKVKNRYNHAINFIKQRGDEMYFEVVCGK